MQRHMYRLRWNSDDHLKELSCLLDLIDDKTLLEVYIDSYSSFNYKSAEYCSTHFKNHKDWKATQKLSSFQNNAYYISDICDKLFTKSILDLRVMASTGNDQLVKLLIEHLKI